ncbi:MAG: hypothetical protein P1U89_18510 [Verrucomicrobiales bacterium]|nr:hypothetical protein [Verrucomicrobiales bacterium]
MKEVTVTDLARSLSDYLNRATYRQEEFLIMRGGKAVATLSPVPTGVKVSDLKHVLGGLPSVGSNDLENFGADLEEVRQEQNEPVVDKWE